MNHPVVARRVPLAAGRPERHAIRPLVIGLGNPQAGDDALGHAVVSRLRERAPGVAAVSWEGDLLGLLDVWSREESVVLVDAVLSGAPPGTLHRLDATVPWPRGLPGPSSHAFDLAAVIELGRILHRFPPRLVLLGIEAGPRGRESVRTPDAWRALDAAVDSILQEIGAARVP